MNQQSREKIALIVFVALIAFVVGGAAWYLNVGHNWNTVGTTIDDATGSLEGYTAIIYDGVAVPSAREASSLEEPLSRASVAGDYESKGAAVVQLHVLEPELYREGVIVNAGGKRIGVLSVTTASESSTYQNRLKQMQDEDLDFTVCITTDVSLLSSDDNVSFDIVVNLGQAKSSSNTKLQASYCVDAPSVGKIGAILVSPSDVVSDRTVSASNR